MELVAFRPVRVSEKLLPAGGNLCEVFTAGTQGGCDPGLSADRGLWKEEGRGLDV